MRQTTPVDTPGHRTLAELPSAPGRVPFMGHTWSLLRRPFEFLESLRTIGRIVRVDIGRTPVYMLTSPELVQSILITHARQIERGTLFDRLREVAGNGLATSEGALHLKQRRLMQPPFKRGNMSVYYDLIRDNTNNLADSWRDEQCVDIPRLMLDLVTRNTTDGLFGLSWNPAAARNVHRKVPIISDNLMVRVQTPKSLAHLPMPANRRFDKAAGEVHELIDEMITQRLNSAELGDDLLGILLAANGADHDQPIGLDQVHDEILTIFLAGIEATGATLAWLWYELERFPEVEARILDEVRTVLDEGIPLEETIGRLDYTRRAVLEILRLHPLLMILRRTIQPIELDNVTLPTGTELGYSPYTLHRDPEFYPDPTRMDPDRWLPERAHSLPAGSFIAFGAGRHQCIGEFFAWAQLMVAIVLLLPRWKLRLAPGQTVREVNGFHPEPSTLRMTVSSR